MMKKKENVNKREHGKVKLSCDICKKAMCYDCMTYRCDVCEKVKYGDKNPFAIKIDGKNHKCYYCLGSTIDMCCGRQMCIKCLVEKYKKCHYCSVHNNFICDDLCKINVGALGCEIGKFD